MNYIAMAVGFVLATIINFGAHAAPAPDVGAPSAPQPDYVEFTVRDIAASKAFYGAVFGWRFTDYGPTYASFDDGRIGGGFTTDGASARGGPLMVFYVADLDATLAKVKAAGGAIVKPPFRYAGGRRFYFRDPNGTVIAAWSEK